MSQADDLRILKFEEVALQLGYSAKHIERLVKEEGGPKVTKLSAKRRGIRTTTCVSGLMPRRKRPRPRDLP